MCVLCVHEGTAQICSPPMDVQSLVVVVAAAAGCLQFEFVGNEFDRVWCSFRLAAVAATWLCITWSPSNLLGVHSLCFPCPFHPPPPHFTSSPPPCFCCTLRRITPASHRIYVDNVSFGWLAAHMKSAVVVCCCCCYNDAATIIHAGRSELAGNVVATAAAYNNECHSFFQWRRILRTTTREASHNSVAFHCCEDYSQRHHYVVVVVCCCCCCCLLLNDTFYSAQHSCARSHNTIATHRIRRSSSMCNK